MVAAGVGIALTSGAAGAVVYGQVVEPEEVVVFRPVPTTTTTSTTTTTGPEPTTTTVPPAPVRARPVVVLTDPLTLRHALTDAGTKVLGRGRFPEADVVAFVSWYHAKESDTRVKPAAPAIAAESWLRERYPNEAYAHDMAEQYENFSGMLNGSGPGND